MKLPRNDEYYAEDDLRYIDDICGEPPGDLSLRVYYGLLARPIGIELIVSGVSCPVCPVRPSVWNIPKRYQPKLMCQTGHEVAIKILNQNGTHR